MVLLLRKLFENYEFIFEDLADPRTKGWFLVDSPWSIIAIVVTYIYFVQTLGPRLMKNREPFKLDRLMQIYNVVQILLNVYIFKVTIDIGWFANTNFRCQPVDYSNSKQALDTNYASWLYYMVKLIDLLDTVFFVLRKKQSQVTFLHVYHHASVVSGCWGCLKYKPNGHHTFIGVINSFVHIIMYSYYLMTSLKIRKPWWKKHLTQLQILQFALILLHFTQILWQPDCKYPTWILFILIPQNLSITALFLDYYYRTYVKKSIGKIEKNGPCANGKGE